MGWERKRGKLARAQPAAARRRPTRASCRSVGAPSTPPADVRYVITLDADTRLPRDAARRLVGTMAHPLNRPRVRSATRPRGRRATASCSRASAVAAGRARGARSSARRSPAPAGIDPYTRAVSDVYQDLFGEGTLHRQGHLRRRRVRARARRPRARERVLSHDLLEGIYARAGLVTDVELFDEFPSRYRRRRRAPAPLDPRRLAARCRGPAAGARDAIGRGAQSRCPASPAGRSSTTCGAAVGAVHAGARSSPAGPCRGVRRAAGPRSSLAVVVVPAAAAASWPALAAAPRRASRKRSHLRAPWRDVALARRAGRARARAARRTRRWLMVDAIVRTLCRLCRHAPAAARMDDRRAGKADARARPRAASTGRWPAASRSRRSSASLVPSSSSRRGLGRGAVRRCCGCSSPALARWLSRRRADGRTRAAVRPPTRPTLRADRAPDLALLRDLRHGRATTACRPTTSRKTRSRSSRTAPRRPTSGCTCSRP